MYYNANIGIVGGGFCGLMTLHHLVETAEKPLFIRAYDEQGCFGKGLAYGTTDPAHLLNVTAAKMGALADRPEDFYQWLQGNPQKWRALHPSFVDATITETSFAPRMIYAAYLKDVLCRLLKQAKRRGHRVELRTFAVRHIDEDLTIHDASGEAWRADRIVLATGHPAPRHFPFEHMRNDRGLLREPWDKKAGAFWQWFSRQEWQPQSHIVLLGTGLSAVDMLHTLKSQQFKGKITAVSRHALLPKPHKISGKPAPKQDILEFPRTALGIYQKLNRDIDRMNLEDRDWRSVIDGIRPITNQLWERMPVVEKRRFLRDFLSWWNVLRHRMPQESFTLVEEMTGSGQLQLRPGKVLHVSRDSDQFTLCIKQRGEEEPLCFTADAIINASGFTYDIAESGNPLLMVLRDQDMIEVSQLRMGIRTDGHYRVIGKCFGSLYALGPLLFGERLESTAVPELRSQAKELTETLLSDIQAETIPQAPSLRVAKEGGVVC